MTVRESELKFTCETFHSSSIRSGIESVCMVDKNFQKNIISSIYFDTDDWSFAMEKAASDFLKTKVRLRWYQSSTKDSLDSPSKCFLEFKRKIGSKREKKRIATPFDGSTILSRINDEEVSQFIQKSITENAPDLLSYQLKPKMLIRYNRNRYFEPFSNTRISFDSDIHAFNVDPSALSSLNNVSLAESVLEVKGDCEELPVALRVFHAGKLKKAAFSKYYECFRLLYDYHQ